MDESQHDNLDPASLIETWMKTAPEFWSSMLNLWPGMAGAWGDLGGKVDGGSDQGGAPMEAALNAWQAIASAVARPEFQDSAVKGINPIPAVMSKIIESGVSGYATLQQQWMSHIQKAQEYQGTYEFENLDKAALHLWSDLYDKEFRKYLNIPQLGLARFHQEKINHLNDRFIVFQSSMAEFLQVLFTPFGKAFATLQEKLKDLADKGELPEDGKSIYQMWVKVLEGHYMKLFKTPEYISTLTNTLDAMAGYTSARQEVTDTVFKLFSLPTKKDMDEVYKEQYLLKKRLRALEKAMQNQPHKNG